MDNLANRLKGSLWGLFVGDALGAPYEFMDRSTYQASPRYQPGGTHGLKAGQWTDDTSMALCIIESLNQKENLDFDDVMSKWLDWNYDGYLSSTGVCFDIGFTTQYALREYKKTKQLFQGLSDDQYSGNGGIMRLSPVAVWSHQSNPRKMEQDCLAVSNLTHPSSKCQACAILMTNLLRIFYFRDHSNSKHQIIKNYLRWTKDATVKEILNHILSSDYEIKSSGYVVHTLETALWALLNSDNFQAGLMIVMNMGGDVDTVGAVYGQLAGAYYGMSGIDSYYLDNLWDKETLEEMVNTLVKNSRVRKV